MEKRSEGEPADWYILAMAHWRLGHKQEARDWFDKAAGWTEKYKPRDRELARYRTEASGLLGLSQPPTSKAMAVTPLSH